MEVKVTFNTNTVDFLTRQQKIFENRRLTNRQSEENYEWVARSGTIRFMFETNVFANGGWWELYDEGQPIKSCGAYVYESSLVIGVRYSCLNNQSKYRYSFINSMLPAFLEHAKNLNCESVIMTFNNYNSHFPRAFAMAAFSNYLNPSSKEAIAGFEVKSNILFNYVNQDLLTLKLSQKEQWYESI